MHQHRLLTLLSDFGLSDVYVGDESDRSNQLLFNRGGFDAPNSSQNIAAARFCLMNAYPYFPSGTVHVP